MQDIPFSTRLVVSILTLVFALSFIRTILIGLLTPDPPKDKE